MQPQTRATVVLGSVVLAAVLSARWLHLNVSSSVPLGVYRLTAVPAQLHVGELVVLPVPASVQAWHSRWLPMIKPIAALPGGTVCYSDNKLFVNGADFGPVLREAHGMPLPHIDDGCQVVPEGSLFLASPVVRSLDSRYYGAVSMTDIATVAFPLVTWR